MSWVLQALITFWATMTFVVLAPGVVGLERQPEPGPSSGSAVEVTAKEPPATLVTRAADGTTNRVKVSTTIYDGCRVGQYWTGTACIWPRR